MVRIKCIEKIEFGNPHPKKWLGFFLALEKVRGRNHPALTFGRHAAICTGTVRHIADLCRNTVMLYRKNPLLCVFQKYRYSDKSLKVYCVIWVEWESLLFIYTCRVRNDANLQYVWCVLAVVCLCHPASCCLGAATLEKNWWKKKESSNRHWLMETICGTNRLDLFSP